MIKASKVFCLIFLACSALHLPAQTAEDPVATATDEAIHRKANQIQLLKTLVDAQNARQRNDLITAHQLYEKCYTLVQSIGSGIEAQTQQTVAGLTEVLMQLAHEAQQRRDYRLADERFARILVINPRNQIALDARLENRQLLEAQAGRIPSQDQIERIPSFRTNEIRVATLVQDGKLLFEAGKIDEAEAKFNQAYAADPANVAAYHYLQTIQQRRIGMTNRRNELESQKSLIEVEKSWSNSRRTAEFEPKPNPYARSTTTHTGIGRSAILTKLERIRIDTIKYDGLPLSEVINNLSELAQSRDPDREGINFLLDRQSGNTSAAVAAGAIDPATGLPVAPLPTETIDLGDVHVKINPAMRNVRLADVLDAITRTADKPIKYSIVDYGIEFSLGGGDPVPLETRTFHVDPNTFRQGLESVSGIPFGNISTGSSGSSGGGGGSGGGSSGDTVVTLVPQVNVTGSTSTGSSGGGGGGGGGGGQSGNAGLRFVTSRTNETAVLQTLVRNFFTAVGVDLNTNKPSNLGKMFVWNDRKGVLLVRSTPADLDMIEAAVQALNQAPPQINIKAKFIEITQNDNRALGFNWYLGGVQLGGTVASGGTQPSLNGQSSAVNASGVFPTQGITSSSSDGLLTGGLRNVYGQQNSATPTIGTLTGILTDPQFRVAIQALEQRDGVEQLTAPEVTTESGRQAQFQAVDIQTIVTGLNVSSSTGSTVSGVANGVNSPIVQATPTANYSLEALPFGPVLDVIPFVSADEYTIQMTIIPTITEFIGYDDPGPFADQALVSGQTGNSSLTAQLPLPHFRMRQVTTSVTVWDSQTVVMGGLLTDTITEIKDKVPLLGDLPLVGRLFQSQSSSKSKKNLMIFVTPTIINPDGTRYHSDEEMPFAQNSFPPQKSVVTQ